MATLCPKCNGRSEVKDSRASPRGTRRRRTCVDCGYKWTTIEIIGSRIPRNMRYRGTRSVENELAAIEGQAKALRMHIRTLKQIFMLEREDEDDEGKEDNG